MSRRTDLSPPSSTALRESLASRLRERLAEIEAATLTRIHAISDPSDIEDSEYVAGLREAVSSGIAYGLAMIEAPRARDSIVAPVPVQLLTQARYAARSEVPLATVLRRYFAGYTLLGDFIVQVAVESAAPASELQQALRGEATLFDRLVASISEEYAREAEGSSRTAEERRVAKVRMLLGGELVDTADLAYEMDAWHIGAIAAGPGARGAIRDLAGALDRSLLLVPIGAGTIWAWLGGRRKVCARRALDLAEAGWSPEAHLALGEPGRGVEGWRLSHRQAKAALPIALRGERSHLAYADVALLASALSDDVLASSLRETFLVPLEDDRDGGGTARETLDAYFAAGRNASSAAAALGVTRKTVSLRLRSVEERLDRSLDHCAAELETALSLQKLARDTTV